MKEQYPKELCDIIRHLSTEKKREYFGVVKSVSDDNKRAEVEIQSIGAISLLNKTGERLAVEDSVLVYATNGNLSNAFIMLRYGASNSDGGGSTVVSDYRQLSNLPSINGVTLVGNNTSESLKITATNADTVDNKHASDFVQLDGSQTVRGNKTFSGAVEMQGNVTAKTPEPSDNSTNIATTAFVKAQDYASGNHTHSDASTSSSGFMSVMDKTKLDGIAENANNYAHPSTHPASMIHMSSGETLQSLFDQAISITDWNDAINPGFYYSANNAANAPTFTGGSGLYGFVFCYNKQVRQVVMPQFGNDCKVRFCNTYDSNTWYSWQPLLPNASTSVNGLMSSLDKTKLNGAASLASPAFTGIPTAPTPTTSTNSDQIATAAFVKNQKYYQLSDYVSADCYVNGQPKYRKIATCTGVESTRSLCSVDYTGVGEKISKGSVLFNTTQVQLTSTYGALNQEFAIVVNGKTVDLYVRTGIEGKLYQLRKGPCFNWWADRSAGDITDNLSFTSNNMSSSVNDVDLSMNGIVTGTIYYSQTV